jgi:hypothetical protein
MRSYFAAAFPLFGVQMYESKLNQNLMLLQARCQMLTAAYSSRLPMGKHFARILGSRFGTVRIE